jgi:hypothetical protein
LPYDRSSKEFISEAFVIICGKALFVDPHPIILQKLVNLGRSINWLLAFSSWAGAKCWEDKKDNDCDFFLGRRFYFKVLQEESHSLKPLFFMATF